MFLPKSTGTQAPTPPPLPPPSTQNFMDNASHMKHTPIVQVSQYLQEKKFSGYTEFAIKFPHFILINNFLYNWGFNLFLRASICSPLLPTTLLTTHTLHTGLK